MLPCEARTDGDTDEPRKRPGSFCQCLRAGVRRIIGVSVTGADPCQRGCRVGSPNPPHGVATVDGVHPERRGAAVPGRGVGCADEVHERRPRRHHDSKPVRRTVGVALPVLCVLGNHEFYRGAVAEVHARRSLLERLADHDAERLAATLRSVVEGAERVVVRTRRRSPRCFSGRGTRRAPRCQLRG